MRFKGLDLNLLVALDALLEERNVTHAGERLHMSQSAMSAALSRLRSHFSDDLLVVSGRRMMPTAFAEAMRQPLREAIFRIEDVVGLKREFEPSTSTRRFKVEIPDHEVPVLLPSLVRLLSIEAPRVILELRPPSSNPSDLLHKGELDLVITPSIYADPAYIREPLVDNELVVVGWKDNPALQRQPDLATVQTLLQIIVNFDRLRLAAFLDERQLDLYSARDRTALVASNFSSIAPCLIGTDRIALLSRRLAELAMRDLPLVIWNAPIPMPRMQDVMMFHPMRDKDPGLIWLREQLRYIAQTDAKSAGSRDHAR
jgi:DNA-binding transcriptional LysR family regulator